MFHGYTDGLLTPPSKHEEPRGKLHCYNYLADIPGQMADCEYVEVEFKNTRKAFFRNSTHLPLKIGDMVAVEAVPGHDIGCVTMIGQLVQLQMRRAGIRRDAEIKRVFRLARPADMEKYHEARAREHDTMIRARRVAESLNLNMKIGDVEFQGDGNKAIFYYIADERVDFRQLIKLLAEAFKIRIEMKQIGARQEAGRIGGIGTCGRPLCCSLWMTNFVSVGTSAARHQDISLNPTKLAGQCGKLKCCLNFEVDTYVEGAKKLPPRDAKLETEDKLYYHFKTDIFKKEITYSTSKSQACDLVTIDAARAFEVIEMNKRGEKPATLREEKSDEKPESKDLLDQDSLTRFDKSKRKKKRRPDDRQRKPQEGATDGTTPPSPKPRREGERSRRDGERPAQEGGKPRGNGGKPRRDGDKNLSENGRPRNEGRRQRRDGDSQPTDDAKPRDDSSAQPEQAKQPNPTPAPED